MALVSPGVEVSVINESFYSPASPGTIPAIFVASAENKINASGTGIAAGTTKNNSERPLLISSQRELAELFGDPSFYTDHNNNPIHGSELNEYGLQTAYSYLGSNNRVWVTRSDLDLSQLKPAIHPPRGNPRRGTYWLDINQTEWGIFVWNGDDVNLNGQRFSKVKPIVVHEDYEMVYGTSLQNGTDGYIPKQSIGKVGSYAIVFGSTITRLFYRNRLGKWVLVGSDAWKASFPVISKVVESSLSELDMAFGSGGYFSQTSAELVLNGDTINVTNADTLEDLVTKINDATIRGISAELHHGRFELFSDGTAGDHGEIEVSGDAILLNELGFQIEESDGSQVFEMAQLHIASHTKIPSFKLSDDIPRPTGSMWIKTTELGGGAKWSLKSWNDRAMMWDSVNVDMYSDHQTAIFNMDRTGGGTKLSTDQAYIQYNVADDDEQLATFTIYKRSNIAPTIVTGNIINETGVRAGTYRIRMSSTDKGSPNFSAEKEITVETTGTNMDAEILAGEIASAEVPNVLATVSQDNRVVITHELGGEIRIVDNDLPDPIDPTITRHLLRPFGFASYRNMNNGTLNVGYVPGTDGDTRPIKLQASMWRSTVDIGDEAVSFYIPGKQAASYIPDHGQLWYNSVVDEVDIMINDGYSWVGYHNYSEKYFRTDPNGPTVSASMPETQSDGTPLMTGDIWIDTSDIDNYPIIRIYNAQLQNMSFVGEAVTETDVEEAAKRSLGWERVDNTDQHTENGIVFADARYNTSGQNSKTPGSIADLLNSDYLDPDAPDPALYPRGILLWNTRRSGFNVKRFVHNNINTMVRNTRFDDEYMNEYYPHRWVSEAPNQHTGAGSFGRIAQRQVVIQALKRTVSTNDEIRDRESRIFNLMATPGYPELISEMISLNQDRKFSSFIVADSPSRLNPLSSSINQWATNENLAIEDNDHGLVSFNDYVGIYYPWGFTSDNFGKSIVVPPSHMMLETIAYSDSVSYPWFAPAGVRRGAINNVSSVGFINQYGEYQTIALNDGQRDTLYENSINPIAFMTGTGIVAYGQKTRANAHSAMDRINVARLMIHIRRMVEQATRSFIFQPNDGITRREVSNILESAFMELSAQRALNDYVVVCDESNNTPTRIRRHELWIDIAVEPINAVEFIYIPIRLRNTGQISGN